MPAYHSSFNNLTNDVQLICGVPLLPLKTRTRGPAPYADPSMEFDAVDEAIQLFKPNCFFKNFEIKGGGDRLMIYGILYISECLNTLKQNMTAAEAQKQLYSLAVSNFLVPGDSSFPLRTMYTAAQNRQEHETLRQYLLQFRQEISARIVPLIYMEDTSSPSKWWLSFQKRYFMGKAL
ncbi:hypothetical protein BB559_006387 [Furculomyces boomerangus]|uniref:Actin-related protein 2/3 complex subunit 3 n=2 Tax=Harpellales TaxID=61421 RepID=A0A2T9XZG5_9FUNG|nr:hypothetical protein BB559_007016 [Furculomyces boomerangus]PVU86826.1 hypothetical protein BB559_006387 [Furculomyces boomerangus]